MGGKREAIPHEILHSYLHFLAWCEQAGLVTQSQFGILMKKANDDHINAVAELARALELREAIYRIFSAVIQRAEPSKEDLGVLNAELAQAMGRLRVNPRKDGHGFAWGWADPIDLDDPLGPVVHSAATLLASDDLLSRLHQCGGDNCGWLFIDSSKNHSRRWCDMRDCGNRAKVRRHRQKQRPEASP
jgi:predicted RNA-binding Zn ribbon-like protein